MQLEDLRVYTLSMEIGEEIWGYVMNWGFFEKDTLGKQLIRSVDSIALNIAEGYGRYHFKETKNFCFIARGSITETRTALKKASARNLITPKNVDELLLKIDFLHKLLNGFIKSIGTIPPNNQ